MDDAYTAALARQRAQAQRNAERFLADLFNVTPVARHSDPVTSHAAADSMVDHAHNQRAEILASIHEHGPQTNDELDFLLGYRIGTASRRTAELIRSGHLIRSDETRLTRTGRAAHILKAAA